MSIPVDLSTLIGQGAGASLTISGATPKNCSLMQFRLGDIDFSATQAINYELTFTHGGECVQASGQAFPHLATKCVRCLCDFTFATDIDLEESYFFAPCSDEHGDPYPTIPDDQVIDIEPLLYQSLLVNAPFAPVHDPDCQGLCALCGADLNQSECDCVDAPDSHHPFAILKDLV
ncbi:MAG: YceD family protein [Coriobacteriia bacterium]|nr:YceD family protein [Coriobacteriia bacterium]